MDEAVIFEELDNSVPDLVAGICGTNGNTVSFPTSLMPSVAFLEKVVTDDPLSVSNCPGVLLSAISRAMSLIVAFSSYIFYGEIKNICCLNAVCIKENNAV